MQRFRGHLAITAVAMTTFITACGGSSSPSGQVTSTLKTYLAALANGKATVACDQITGSEVQALEQSEPTAGAPTCVQAVRYLSQSLGGDDKQTLINAKVIDVQVNGDSATAQLKGGTSTAHFTKTGGHWYISGGVAETNQAASSQQGSSTTTAAPTTAPPNVVLHDCQSNGRLTRHYTPGSLRAALSAMTNSVKTYSDCSEAIKEALANPG